VSPERCFAFVLHSLVAFLLAVSPMAAELVRAASNSAVDDASCKAALLDQDQALDDTVETQAKADASAGGIGPDWRSLPASPGELTLDRVRFIRIGQVSHPTAPPGHRPCAAPPTGPPTS
jgi:hypothetical protein